MNEKLDGNKYFDEALEAYIKLVIPPNASKHQKEETILAFYAGSHTMLQVLMACLENRDAHFEESIHILADLSSKVQAFIHAACVRKREAESGERTIH